MNWKKKSYGIAFLVFIRTVMRYLRCIFVFPCLCLSVYFSLSSFILFSFFVSFDIIIGPFWNMNWIVIKVGYIQYFFAIFSVCLSFSITSLSLRKKSIKQKELQDGEKNLKKLIEFKVWTLTSLSTTVYLLLSFNATYHVFIY